MCKEYSGWENYPTWAVALWIDSDEWLNNEALDLAHQIDISEPSNQYATVEQDLAVALHEWVEELCEIATESSMRGDLLSWALEMVNWRQLATHYLSTLQDWRQA